jgi:hypothetical protein
MIREGNATPAWLANDFNASRRHALIVAQVIKLGQKLTDDAVTMFIKLMGRLFSQANNRKKQRHMDCGRIPPRHCACSSTRSQPCSRRTSMAGTHWRFSIRKLAGIDCFG